MFHNVHPVNFRIATHQWLSATHSASFWMEVFICAYLSSATPLYVGGRQVENLLFYSTTHWTMRSNISHYKSSGESALWAGWMTSWGFRLSPLTKWYLLYERRIVKNTLGGWKGTLCLCLQQSLFSPPFGHPKILHFPGSFASRYGHKNKFRPMNVAEVIYTISMNGLKVSPQSSVFFFFLCQQLDGGSEEDSEAL